jgi:amino acid transporter
VILGAFGFLTWVNVVGMKQGANAAVVLTIGKLIPLVFFAVAGIWFVDWSVIGTAEMPAFSAVNEAALLLLFAYAGFENTAAAAGEFQNPKRDVPFALLTMVTIVTVLYCVVQLVAVGTLPGLAESGSALADSATLWAGAWAGVLMTLGAVISIGGNMGSTTLAGPRYLFALARDGFGPEFLARIHPRYRTPAAAIITQSAIGVALALSGTFVQLAMLSIVARMATYLGTVVAIPVLRKRFGDRPGSFRLPGGLIIPAAALVISLVFLSSAEMRNLVAGGIALLIGLVIYRFRRAV